MFSHIACYYRGKHKAYTHSLEMFEEFGDKFKQLVQEEKKKHEEEQEKLKVTMH